MEQQFVTAWAALREKAGQIGVRMRPVEPASALQQARRILSGHKESDGFWVLAEKGRSDLSLEALAVDKRFTGLFSDEEANSALTRLLDADYHF